MSKKNGKPQAAVSGAPEPVTPPGRKEQWTVQEALIWIAYRVDPEGVPDVFWPMTGPFVSPNTMGALAARAARNPRSWPGADGVLPDGTILRYFKDPFPTYQSQVKHLRECSGLVAAEMLVPFDSSGEQVPAYTYRAAAKRWMKHTGLTAAELLTKAVADRAKYLNTKTLAAEQSLNTDAALVLLNSAVSTGRITAYGRPANDWRLKTTRPREAIPATVVDEIRALDASGRLFIQSDRLDQILGEDDGPFYVDIRLVAAEVTQLWPENGTSAPGVGEASVKNSQSSPLSRKSTSSGANTSGGRPPRHDWDAFWIEITLWEKKNGSHDPGRRPLLQKHMVEWATDNWGDEAPDPRTIQGKLQKLFEAK